MTTCMQDSAFPSRDLSIEPNVSTCRALFVCAPASGTGKTTVTAALAYGFRRAGLRVRVFKTGPDFLDPMVLAQASGAPVYQLDLWMGGAEHCQALLHEAAQQVDLILIEGVMGLFDGEPSGADLAERFNIPLLAVIDSTAMAQTFGAVAFGLANFRPGLNMFGVLANRVGSERHAAMLRESLPPGLVWCGALPRDNGVTLPSRHLGLMQAEEIMDLDIRLKRLADLLFSGAGQAQALLPPRIQFAAPSSQAMTPTERPLLAGVTIGVARDAAFSFIYQANLDQLRALGAELRFFSPLADATLPEADSLYFPGGYPELHLQQLADNAAMKAAIAAHHRQGKPIVAECGGMLFLLQSLTDQVGVQAQMTGLLPGHAKMQTRLANLGMQQVSLPEGVLRGHTYHHSTSDITLEPIAHGCGKSGKPEPVFRCGRLQVSYLHLYFPSNPDACAALFTPTPGKVWFVGAGPGDPELITLKGRHLIAKAGAILFAGSLVSEGALQWAPAGCEITDSKDMTLSQITDWLKAKAQRHATVVRLQTGDPGLYGALIEMVQPLDEAGIAVEVVPGVSSAMASMAAAVESMTLPEVTQTVIFTRVEGRTPMPAGESLPELAAHNSTLCVYLSITLLKKIRSELLAAGWSDDTPILVVQKASWPEQQRIVRGTLADIRDKCLAQGITSQAMIVISPTLGARYWPSLTRSKLYDPQFGHRFRRAEILTEVMTTMQAEMQTEQPVN